jgi:two-component system, OmpR family, response regulator
METPLSVTAEMKVLVVEDEVKAAEFIRKALSAESFAVEWCGRGDEALDRAMVTAYDAIVLDIMLPGRDGLSVLRLLRERGNNTPVLLLSARSHVSERVDGLNAGADDYLSKPYALEELTARVKALGRRGGESRSVLLKVGNLVLDTVTRIAQRGAQKVELSAREYRLLEYLMRHPGRVCTRMLLLEKVWDYDFDPGTNLVDVTIRRLRERMDAPGEPLLIHTVRGQGYMMYARP